MHASSCGCGFATLETEGTDDAPKRTLATKCRRVSRRVCDALLLLLLLLVIAAAGFAGSTTVVVACCALSALTNQAYAASRNSNEGCSTLELQRV